MATKWAYIGEEGEPFSEKAAVMLGQRSPYEIRRRDGKLFFRSPYDDRLFSKSIKISQRITKENYRDPSHHEFFNHGDLLEEFANVGGFVDFDAEKILEIFEKYQGFRRFEKMSKVLFFANSVQFPSIFTDTVAPYFFDQYPNGAIYFFTSDFSLHQKLAALRVLGSLDRIASRNIEVAESYPNFSTLSGAQPSFANPGRYLTIPFAMSLPKPIGFCSSKVIDGTAFLFGKPSDDVREPYPKSGIEFFKSSASNILLGEKGEYSDNNDLDLEALDTFQLLGQEFVLNDWWDFIRQYIGKLNSLIAYLTDPSNFVDNEDSWVNITQYLVWLSFERLCDEVILLLAEENHYLRKMASFRILDQLASFKFDEARKQVEMFKDILMPKSQNDIINAGLEKYSGAVATHLKELLTNIRNEMRTSIIDSIQYGDRFDSASEKVILFSNQEIDVNEYVARVIRQLRNTAHGYSSVNKVLLTNRGNVPDSFPLIALLAFLSFVASPEEFLRSKWN